MIDDGARLGGISPVEPEAVDDVLRSPSAGGKVVRGGALRAVGYGAAIIVGTATAALLLRHLGVDDFGRYVTVTALLGIVAALAGLRSHSHGQPRDGDAQGRLGTR